MNSIRLRKLFSVILTLVILLGCFSVSKIDTQAKSNSVTEKEKYYEQLDILGTYSVSGSNIKINGKAVKKMKKKVKAIRTYSDPYGDMAYKGKYYINDSYAGYKEKNGNYNYEKYSAAREKFNNSYKYKKTEGYELKFLKAGTYTISYQTYGTTTKYDEKKYSESWEDPNAYRVGLITKHIIKIRVAANTSPIKSIKLGKAITSYKNTAKKFKSTSTSKSNHYLTSSSAKLTVSANSGYSVTSIIVKTRDKNGNTVYKQVKNKSNIAINTYKPTSTDPKYLSNEYPETTVYIGYKDKFYGTSTSFSYNETTKKFTFTRVVRGYKDDYSPKNNTPDTTYSFKPEKGNPNQGYWTIVRRNLDYFEYYGNTKTETFYYTK